MGKYEKDRVRTALAFLISIEWDSGIWQKVALCYLPLVFADFKSDDMPTISAKIGPISGVSELVR